LAMHAGHRDGALALLAVIQRDDAATVDAPRNLMLVLAGGDAGVAFDAALGVAEEFHTGHDLFSPRLRLCRLDAAQRDFGFLHVGDRVVAVAGDLVRAFAEHDRIGALRVLRPLGLALPVTREVERHEGHADADTRGDERLHLRLRAALRTIDPDILA